jgi:hypothetical protein
MENLMQTPDEIYARWQPEPNSKMSHWIDTLHNLSAELEQLQELRQQRCAERAAATLLAQEKGPDLLMALNLLDQVISRTDEEIARLREREYWLEQKLNAAATRLTAACERVQAQLHQVIESRQSEGFNLSTFSIFEEGISDLLANQRHR